MYRGLRLFCGKSIYFVLSLYNTYKICYNIQRSVNFVRIYSIRSAVQNTLFEASVFYMSVSVIRSTKEYRGKS